jgi:hypothetical protein
MVSAILVLANRELQRESSQESEEEVSGEQTFLRLVSKAHASSRPARRQSIKLPMAHIGALYESGSPGKKGQMILDSPDKGAKGAASASGSEGDDLVDDLEPLEPLQLSRSLSVPVSGPKGSVRPTGLTKGSMEKPGAQAESATSLDEDEQLLAIFKLAVWICKRPDEVLSKLEKAAILGHIIQNMNILAKRARSVASLSQMVQMG